VSLVLDSSVTLAWAYGDETIEPTRKLFDAIADSGAVVPALWGLEVANSLLSPFAGVASMQNSARRRSPTWPCSTSPPNLLPIPIPGPRRCGWQIASGSRCMTPPIWSLRTAALWPLATLDKDLSAATAALSLRLLGGAA